MAQQEDAELWTSKESKLKWTTAKKKEYKKPENDWRNIPLFSNVLDPSNSSSAAILALQKKEKPRNRAKEYKNSGNKACKLGPCRYADAITYYTQALGVKCKDKTLNATIYANRAQINLCLKNYGKVIADCKESIRLQPNCYKSYWRAATALRALSKYSEAITFCEDGLIKMDKLIQNEKENESKTKKIESSSDESSESEDESSEKNKKKIQKTELQKLEEQYVKLTELREICRCKQLEIEKKKKIENEQRIEAERADNLLKRALSERGIVIGSEDKYNLSASYGQKYKISLDDKMNSLVFPVLFIYPEVDQSDFIKAFGENEHFLDHLNQMFAPNASAPDWDQENKYLSHRLRIFYETEDRFVNVNMHKSLKDIVERRDYVIPILPVFFVLCRDTDFTKDFIRKKSKEILE